MTNSKKTSHWCSPFGMNGTVITNNSKRIPFLGEIRGLTEGEELPAFTGILTEYSHDLKKPFQHNKLVVIAQAEYSGLYINRNFRQKRCHWRVIHERFCICAIMHICTVVPSTWNLFLHSSESPLTLESNSIQVRPCAWLNMWERAVTEAVSVSVFTLLSPSCSQDTKFWLGFVSLSFSR